MEDASEEKVRFMELGWRTVLSILITKIPLLLTWLCLSASITIMNNSNNNALSFLGISATSMHYWACEMFSQSTRRSCNGVGSHASLIGKGSSLTARGRSCTLVNYFIIPTAIQSRVQVLSTYPGSSNPSRHCV